MSNRVLFTTFDFCKSARIGKFILSACFAFILNTVSAQQAFTAVNDTVKTGPLQSVTADVIKNDTIPCEDYTWRVMLAPAGKGTMRKQGDNLIFTPRVDCRNDTVRISYGVKCGGVEKYAMVVIIVSSMSLPINVIDPYTPCVNDMPFNVDFEPALKYVASTTSNSNSIPTDGFSLPLVGDINGDGKPEIVALGLGRTTGSTDGSGLSGRAWYVHVYNGQNGQRLWSVNLGTEPSGGISNVTSLGHSGITSNLSETDDQFQLRFNPRHNSPGHLAIADLDRDGKAEIVVAEVGNIGRIYALNPTLNPTTRAITGFTKKWTGNVNGTAQSYKAPYTSIETVNNHARFGSAVPYITDLNHDGRPEVIVYNKIYDGIDGLLVCELEELNAFNYTTSSSANNTNFDKYAFVGRRPGAADKEDFVPCVSIADIDGDGIIDIIAGSKVYLMKNEVINGRSMPKLKSIIKGPSQVTAQRGKGTGSFTCQVNDGFTSVVDIDLDGRLDVVVFASAMPTLNNITQSVIYVWDPLNNPTTPKAVTYLYTNANSGTFSYPFVGDINGRLDDWTGTKRLPEICMVAGRLWANGGFANGANDTWTGSKLAVHPSSSGLSLSNSSFNADNTSSIRGHVMAFTYHANPDGSTPIHQRLKLSWAMEHKDESSSTGITMFDFDNDGIRELVYRDELSLRIISPAGSNSMDLVTNSYVSSSGADKSIIRLYQPGVRSYTGYEAPVIADVDLDGSADIITTGTDATFNASNTSSDSRSRGYIYVFEHKGGKDKWAPCPPVWNQTIYFPLQINENLTVPPYPQSRLTPYTNRHGETIYPYNGHWMQQPIVREGQNFIPVVRNPNAVITNMKVEVGVPDASKTRVTLTIKNIGSASLNANTPISFYTGGMRGSGGYDINDTQNTQFIVKMNLGEDIFPNGLAVRSYDLAQNLNNTLVWARVVDNNRNFPATGYTDCDLSNNAASGADCPWLVYSITASDTIICGSAGEAILTAVPTNTPNTPSYKWYRNDNEIPGATSAVYVARQPGTYKCFIREDICSCYTPEKTITRIEAIANDDYAVSVNGATIKIPILDNDSVRRCVPMIPSISVLPSHGNAVIINDTLVYTPQSGYYGYDTLRYGIPAEAFVYISMTKITEARNDTIVAITADPTEVNILANDVIVDGCTPTISISVTPLHGGAYRSGNKIIYTSANHYTGFDSLTYKIQCGNEISYAKIIIKVIRSRVIYVKETATGAGDGSSWQDAYGNLADPLLWAAEQRLGIATGLGAVNSQVDTIREIWVAAGTYYPMHKADTLSAVRYPEERYKAFVLVNGVKIYGGFPANANDTDHNLVSSRHTATATIAPTVLSGDIGTSGYDDDNSYNVVIAVNIPNNTETVLDGFIISDAKTTNAPSSPLVNGHAVDCISAIYCYNASPVLANLKVSGNSGYYGGGIYARNSSPQIFNTLISGNSASSGCGSLYFAGSSPILTNVTVSGNYGLQGGVRASTNSNVTLNNCIVWGNHSTHTNVASTPQIHSVFIEGNSTVNISHSLIQHSGGSSSWNTAAGNDLGGNIDTNPYFIAEIPAVSAPNNNGNYRIDYNSPALNSGKNEHFPHNLQNIALLRNCYDINGDFRLVDNNIDMGAYEHQAWTVPPTPRIFYVKEGGSGNKTGDTWQDAYPNLADPVLWAYQQREGTLPVVYPGDTIAQIWVAEGTYYPMYMAGTGSSDRDKAFVLSEGLKIYGGFPQGASDTQHTSLDSRFTGVCKGSPCLSETILSGDLGKNDASTNIKTDNVYHLFIANNVTDNTVIDGFTLTGGQADGSGAINLSVNTVSSTVPRNMGGAIYNVKASPRYSNLRIVDNYADRSGGGVYCDNASSAPSFIASTLSGNRAKRDGGAISLNGGDIRMINSAITGNCADSIGGAMNVIAGKYLLLNSTIAGNHADSTGGGIYMRGNIIANVKNSIIWGNNTKFGRNSNIYRDTVQTVYNNVSVDYQYSIVGGARYGHNLGAWNPFFGTDGGNNLDMNPQFEDYITSLQNGWQATSSGDYRLQYGSSALGAASETLYMNSFNPPLANMLNEVDLGGNTRVFGVMDLGAYENQTIPPPTSSIMYVKTNGNGDGSSWDNAYPNLADPLSWANMQRKGAFGPVAINDTIREIWVAAGTYKPMHRAALHRDTLNQATTDRDKAFVLVDGVKIYGGFPANASTAANSALESRFPAGCSSRGCLAPTILSGDLGLADIPGNMTANKADNAYHVVIAAGTYTNALLDGFIIEGGNANDNAGNFVVVNKIFVDSDKGGGLYCVDSTATSSPQFKNLVFRGNIARKYGGGIYIGKSSPIITHSLVSGNIATGSTGQGIGGGMTVFNGNASLTDVRISGNQALTGAGAALISASNPRFNNVTVSGNRAQNASGGIYINGTAHPTFNNSIIWGNVAPLAPEVQIVSASAIFNHSLVSGSGGSSNWTLSSATDGGGNLDADPLFTARVNPSQSGWQPTEAGDYTLKHCSPAIDAGNNAAHPNINSVDLDGNARISGGKIDMGAYEKALVTGLTNGIFYVKQTCRGTGNGSSWNNAYGNLADPLLWADHQHKGTFGPVAAGDTIRQIWIAEGTYIPRHKIADNDENGNPTTDRDKAFVLVKGVKIYGGFPDNANNTQHTTLESRGSDMAHFATTTLSGDLNGDDLAGNFTQYKTDNAYHVIVGADIPADGKTVIDGFVISEGQADGNNYKVEVNNEQFLRTEGGGIIIVNASPLFSCNIVESNFAESGGAGISAKQSLPQIDKLTFRSNHSEGDGGGILIKDNSRPEFTNVNISGNRAANTGGGMMIDASEPVFIDALVNGNLANEGGGIAIKNNCQPDFVNVTVGGNLAQNRGGGLSFDISSPTFKNSIIWGNTASLNSASNSLFMSGGANPEYIRSLVQGSGGSSAWLASFGIDGGNNIDVNPMFNDLIISGHPSVAGDYRLKNGSPAINRGDSVLYKQAMSASFLYGTQLLQDMKDLDGTQRVLNGNIDIGAYEKALEIKPNNGVFYVKQNFHGNADGSSWNDAYGNLGDPLLWAAQQRDGSLGIVDQNDTIREIWVAEGKYRPMHFAGQAAAGQQINNDKAFVLVNGVKLYGGFPDNANDVVHINIESRFLGNCTGRACLMPTILSGDLLDDDDSTDFAMTVNKADNAAHVIVAADIDDDKQTVIDGFIVTEGYADGVSYIELNSGTKIYREDGGGIYQINASPVYSNLRIISNRAAGKGGGLFVNGSGSRFERVEISGNKAKSGGGLLSEGDSMMLINCAMTGNYSETDGGAVNAADSKLALINTSVAGNYADGDGGGLSLHRGLPEYAITNSIIWGNKAQSNPTTNNIHTSKEIGYSYSLVEDAFPNGQWDANLGTNLVGNIDQDPTFVNYILPSAATVPVPTGNYRLMHGSPAINAADTSLYKNAFAPPLTSMYDEVDLEGMPRLAASVLDMGALEAATPIPATTRRMFVKNGNRGTGSGDSWLNAYGNLADPLLWAYMQRNRTAGRVAATDTICEIWVAEGTYYPLHKAASHNGSGLPSGNEHKTFTLVDGVKIYGGFPDTANDNRHTTLTTRDVKQHKTRLNGAIGQISGGADSVYHVVVASNLKNWNGESPTLDGFIITGGNAKGDGASFVTIKGNIIYDNVGGGLLAINSDIEWNLVEISRNESKETGGGIYAKNSSISISSGSVDENTAARQSGDGGGGIYSDNSTLILNKVLVSRNSGGTALGGGIHTYDGTFRAIGTEITGNKASGGGGLFLDGTKTDLINVLIAGNATGTTGTGGGILSADNNVRMTNVTIGGNSSSAGSAIYANQSSSVTVNNSIVWGNKAPTFSPTGTFSFESSLVEGSGGSTSWTGIAGADAGNNTDGNPLFVTWTNPATTNGQPVSTDDYRLLPGSPVVNTGDSALYKQAFNPPLQNMQGQLDLDALPRVIGSTLDRGAYEATTLMRAVNDLATTDPRTSIAIDVLANDVLLACNRSNLAAIAPLSALSAQNGILTLNPDSTINYTPPSGFTGIDYFDYYVKCNADSSAARVTIAVIKPKAWNYIACLDAEVTLAVDNIGGVKYWWYNAFGAFLAQDTSSYTVIKNSNSVQSFLVEPHFQGLTFPRYRIDLTLSDDCGNSPSACATDGTLLFREDFGGNESDPDYSNSPLPHGTTEYQLVQGLPSTENQYCLAKKSAGNQAWYSYDDHTFAGDTTKGYMMVINAGSEKKLLYHTDLDGLCIGSKLNVSAWIGNLTKANLAPQEHPNLRFVLTDPANGDVLAEYITGEIQPEQTADWKLFGFAYTSTGAAVQLSIYNAATGNGDNDLAIDDVEIRLCVPPVTMAQPANDFEELCEGSSFSIDGSYIDNNTFGTDLIMRLEYNASGQIYEPSQWTTVSGTELTSSAGSIDTVYSFAASPSNAGYYRVVVANPLLIGLYRCRSMSRIVYLDVTKAHVPPDVRIYLKPEAGMTLNLSAYIDSLDRPYSLKWTAGRSVPFVPGTENTTGTVEFSSPNGYFSTYIYTCDITDSICGTRQAKAYVRILQKNIDTLTVRICKDLPETDRINLNQILGLESLGAQWTWLTNSNNVFSDNITIIPAGNRHEGAYLFNALQAFAQAGTAYYHLNNPNEKKFEFEYANPAGTMKKRVKLIVY
ncbi:MAG: hypothetical protein LBC98_07235 [Prevotellaceae bacterium]|jgi:archaellin|nr:hypothetical protein [Prevotellaceae bacterium]